MGLLRIFRACLLVLAFAGPAQAQDLVPVPPLSAHLTDQAGLLNAEQRARLEAVLADYEAKTGSQIAVLIVKTTAPEQIKQYSIRVADAWKLGRKGVDDGVLLLVAPGNTSAMRRLRIEAGRGVQGVLTDAKSKQVLQDVIAPHFRNQQFYEGLAAGVGAIATTLNAEKFPPPPAPKQQAQRQQADGGVSILKPLLFIGFIVLLLKIMGGGGARRLGSNGWGSGAAGFIIGSVLSNASHGGGSSGGGGFSDGGGFSGGGGSFDGGGASGDW